MGRLILLLAAGLVLVSVGPACAQARPAGAEELRARVQELAQARREGRLEVDDPARARRLLEQGRAAVRRRDYGRARALLAELESIVRIVDEEAVGPADDVAATRPPSSEEGCPFGVLDPYFNVPEKDDVAGFFADIGITHARFGAPKSGGIAWNIEQSPGRADWTTGDAVIRHAASRGLDILVTINPINKRDQETRVPKPGKREDYFQLPVNLDGYEQFVVTAVGRYADAVRDWQVHNEPDGHFWSDTPENYARLVAVTSRAVRRADPDARVVLAGIADAGFLRRVLQQLKADGVEDAFDVADFHHFKLAKLVPERPDFGTYRQGREVHDRVRLLLKQYGCGDVPIWITETSTYAGQPTVPVQWPAQTEREQAQDLVKRLVYPLAYGVERVYWTTFVEWYNFNDLGENHYFDNVGLVRNPRHGEGAYKKLSYYTFRRLVEVLDGVTWQEADLVIDNQDDVSCVAFPAPEGKRYVIWWDGPSRGSTEAGVTVVVPVGRDGVWESLSLVPDGTTGNGMADADLRFTSRQVEAVDGRLRLMLGADPVVLKAAPVR